MLAFCFPINIFTYILNMWEIEISMKTWEKTVKKLRGFYKKLENCLNGKICAAPLTAATYICISSKLFLLFLFNLAALHCAAPR